jgi:hypothetical protein
VETAIHEDAKKQAEMEARLLRIWAQGRPETKTVEEVFGPYENWLFPLGTHLLLLDPALKEWFRLDKLHDTWERTGFGPGEVVFVAYDKRLGFRRKKDASRVPPTTAEVGAKKAIFCTACGARLRANLKFCTQCGARVKVR